MWSKSHTVVTTAIRKEQIWNLFADVNNWTQWDKSIEMAQLDGPFQQGNHFLFQPKGGPKMKIAIHETVPYQRFVDCTTFPLAKMYGIHTFKETANGLELTTTMQVSGPLGFLWRKIVAEKIVAALPQDMQIQIEAAAKL